MAGTMKSFKKAYGALKDSTKVGLANFNSEYKVIHSFVIYMFSHFQFQIIFVVFVLINVLLVLLKDLDIAIVKATNHVEYPPKERHIRSELLGCNVNHFSLPRFVKF